MKLSGTLWRSFGYATIFKVVHTQNDITDETGVYITIYTRNNKKRYEKTTRERKYADSEACFVQSTHIASCSRIEEYFLIFHLYLKVIFVRVLYLCFVFI